MEINEMNYEMFALDYAEGNLSGEYLQSMELFLSHHPKIKEEISEIANISIPITQVVYEDKSGLKKKKRRIAFLPVALAVSSAACLLLGFGLFRVLSLNSHYGNMAADTMPLNINYNINIIGIQKNDNPTKRYEDHLIADSETSLNDQVNGQAFNDINRAGTPVAYDVSLNQLSQEELASLETLAYNQAPIFHTPALRIKLTEVKTDDIYILPVTIELHDLAMDGYDVNWINESSLADQEKAARKKIFKESALSLLQDAFVPKGVNKIID